MSAASCFTAARRRLPVLLLTCCLLWVSGCAGLFNPGPPPSRLQLSPPMPAKMAEKPFNKQLVVATPLAGREIDSDNIALVFNEREVRVLADARWTGTAPSLVQRNVIAALESAGALSGVADESAGIAADARLLSDIRQFSLHYTEEGGMPGAVFEGTFRLLNLSTGKVVGIRSVDIKVPASSRDKTALVRAMETALGQGLHQIVPWIVEEMRKINTE